MKGNRFKQDNRGASLLAVLVLMVVVSLIAVVITKITIVNIEMKEVERGTKKNFYSADELMDNLRAGARELAEQSLEKAYAAPISKGPPGITARSTCRMFIPIKPRTPHIPLSLTQTRNCLGSDTK